MIQQKTGNEHFTFDEMPQGFLLQDFWRWQSSDLLNNTLRGILAEFLVAKALGMDTSEPRVEWDSYDLLFNDRVCEPYGTHEVTGVKSCVPQGWGMRCSLQT